MSVGEVLTLHYWPADGSLARIVVAVVLGLPVVFVWWLLFLCLNQLRIIAGIVPSNFDNLQLVSDPGSPWEVIACGVVLLPVALVSGLLATEVTAASWRSRHRRWWLRLDADGFQVNDRLCRPRAYRWADIDEFLLVYPPGSERPAVAPEAQSVGQVLRDGAEGPVVRVGFRYLPDRRRHPRRQADHYIMGYWDRPVDPAVRLMNEWLQRHRPAVRDDPRQRG